MSKGLVAPLLLVLLAATASAPALAQSAPAGDLAPIVGSQVWLVPPEGFETEVEPSPTPGFLNRARGAAISASWTPFGFSSEGDFDLVFTNPDVLAERTPAIPGATSYAVETGGRRFIVLGMEFPPEVGHAGRMWSVAVEGHKLQLNFAQFDLPGVAPVFDRAAIDRVLASVEISPDSVTDDGVQVGSLYVPALPPFTFAEVNPVGGATLWTSKGNGPHAPSIRLLFPKFDPDAPTLESLALRGPNDAAILTGSDRVTLAGVPAFRQHWSFNGGDGQPRSSVRLFAVMGGQLVLVYVNGLTADLTPAVIEAFDAIAAAIRVAEPEPVGAAGERTP
jgi:hypothetical protein